MSFSSRPGNSVVISISLSVSLTSMLGISSREGKPAKPREKPSNRRSTSCCKAENGLDEKRATPRSFPTGIRDFNVMVGPPKSHYEPFELAGTPPHLQGSALIEVKPWLARRRY